MKTITFLILLMMNTLTALSQNDEAISKLIIEKEKSALARWYQGDPSGYLEIYADDIVYFDPYIEQRMDGLDKLTDLYESIRGQIHVEQYELLNPKVQSTDKMAVLTFNLVAVVDDKPEKWNCTEVYRLDPDQQWRIIQTHWSYTKPELR